MRSSWSPCSTRVPSRRTQITSAFLIVERRCATTTTVILCSAMRASNASCTPRSDSASRAEVASSSSSTAGPRTKARAMATRCFWPPESWMPRSPTCVS
mmetsp:Transcript_28879/g.99699  ORF Transcript_28879/g.99699 Transcript_28879/m.99699 type:complete len:99 (-) Transcript_28879:5363-5659(-)